MNPALVRNGLSLLSYINPRRAALIGARIFSSPRPIARPLWERRLVRLGRVEFFEDRIHLVKWGDEKAPAILLVHGWAGRGTQLGSMVDPLVKLGYQVIAFDAPAHGESLGSRTNIGAFTEALNALGVDIAEKGVELRGVIAHSFGAISTLLALTRGLQARSVILVAAPARLQWILDHFTRRMGFSPYGRTSFQRELERRARVRMEDVDVAKLGKLTSAQALIVHDPEDEDVPYENAEEFVSHWPESRLLTIEGVGHRKILKSPQLIEAAVAFFGPAPSAI